LIICELKPITMQKNQRVFYSKESAIESLIEQANENKCNLYLKKVAYYNSFEYVIIPPEEVMNYCEQFYVGHYRFASKNWICFSNFDNLTPNQIEGRRKQIIIPDIDIQRPGIF